MVRRCWHELGCNVQKKRGIQAIVSVQPLVAIQKMIAIIILVMTACAQPYAGQPFIHAVPPPPWPAVSPACSMMGMVYWPQCYSTYPSNDCSTACRLISDHQPPSLTRHFGHVPNCPLLNRIFQIHLNTISALLSFCLFSLISMKTDVQPRLV